MSIASVMEDIHGRKVDVALSDAYGRLFPKNNTSKGVIIATLTAYGEYVIIDSFTDINDSPWLYDALNNVITKCGMEVGKVYQISVTIKVKKDRTEGKYLLCAPNGIKEICRWERN